MKMQNGRVKSLAAAAGEAVEQLNAPTRDEVGQCDSRPEFVTPAQAWRDLRDANPRIRRYAETVLGLSAEVDRRDDIALSKETGGHLA